MHATAKSFRYRRPRGGSVLVLVLIVVASLTILSFGLAYRTRIDMRLAKAYARRTQAYYLALGGIERVKTLLGNTELSPETVGRICQFSGTSAEEGLFEQFGGSEVCSGGLALYSLHDEQAYFNINSSDPAAWENMEILGRELRASILDWIDADGDTNPDGAETDYYERLDLPYVSKNKPVAALKELLFIRGVDRDIYIGEDLNRNLLLEANERDGSMTVPRDNEDNTLDVGLVDIFGVCGDGSINLNTASGMVLGALPGVGEEAAEIITAYRCGPDARPGTDDDIFLTGREDLATVEGLTELQVELLVQYCRFDSNCFRIFSNAILDNTPVCCLMASVSLADGEPLVLCLERVQ